jgi:hypothetical protein
MTRTQAQLHSYATKPHDLSPDYDVEGRNEKWFP